MTTQAQQIADMATTIRCTTGMVGFIAGNEPVENAAECWIDAGFTADDAPAWWEAGCFDADSASVLRDAGLTPEQVGERHDTDEPESWGYRHSNGDVSTAKVCEHFGLHEYHIHTDAFSYDCWAESLDDAIEEAFSDELDAATDEDSLREEFEQFVADGGWCWIEEDGERVVEINC
jgi:hypothetical protein